MLSAAERRAPVVSTVDFLTITGIETAITVVAAAPAVAATLKLQATLATCVMLSLIGALQHDWAPVATARRAWRPSVVCTWIRERDA